MYDDDEDQLVDVAALGNIESSNPGIRNTEIRTITERWRILRTMFYQHHRYRH